MVSGLVQICLDVATLPSNQSASHAAFKTYCSASSSHSLGKLLPVLHTIKHVGTGRIMPVDPQLAMCQWRSVYACSSLREGFGPHDAQTSSHVNREAITPARDQNDDGLTFVQAARSVDEDLALAACPNDKSEVGLSH